MGHQDRITWCQYSEAYKKKSFTDDQLTFYYNVYFMLIHINYQQYIS